jgi:hypothetical protein
VEILGINSTQGGFHGSVHRFEDQTGRWYGVEVEGLHRGAFGDAHLMTQEALAAWLAVFGYYNVSPMDENFINIFGHGNRGMAGAWREHGEARSLDPSMTEWLLRYVDNTQELSDEQRAWIRRRAGTHEHEIWAKQRFIEELNIDYYTAIWEFYQHPLPNDPVIREEVIQMLRMNELNFNDVVYLFGTDEQRQQWLPSDFTLPTFAQRFVGLSGSNRNSLPPHIDWTPQRGVFRIDPTQPPAPAVVPVFAPIRTPITATPTTARVALNSLNGEELDFVAFNINGHNFFRVRDIAYALSDTPARFGIAWDSDTSTIILSSGVAYASGGGATATATSNSPRTANPSSVNFSINGRSATLTTYNIDGTNFVRLRDLATALDTFDVQFIDGTIVIIPN